MVQSKTHKMGETVKILIIKIDQKKYDEFISSLLTSPETAWHYHCMVNDIKAPAQREKETPFQWESQHFMVIKPPKQDISHLIVRVINFAALLVEQK